MTSLAESKEEVNAAALRELADKYRTIANLRRAKRAGAPDPDRSVFQQLAARFPGALNELETLTLSEVDDRARLLSEASDCGIAAPWMSWIWRYHALLRGALELKRQRHADRLDQTAAEREAGAPLSPSFLAAVTAPDGRRLVEIVFEEIARCSAGDAETIADTLFPRRRAARTRTGAVLAPDQDVG